MDLALAPGNLLRYGRRPRPVLASRPPGRTLQSVTAPAAGTTQRNR